MEKLSMKTVDIAFQAAGKTKAPNQTGDVSGDYDFRKMLQSKDEDAQGKQDSKEVTKDKDQDTATDKTEVSGEQKQEGVSKDKTDKTDSKETDTSQAEAMIAAQMCQRLSCGFAVVEQKTGEQATAPAPEMAVQVQTEAEGKELMMQMTDAKETEAVQVQTEAEAQQVQMPETGRVETVLPKQAETRPEQMQGKTEVKAAEAMSVVQTQDASETQQQPQDFSSNLKEAVKTEQPQEKGEVQSEQFMPEQAAAAVRPEAERIPQPEVEKPETIARVYVEQPDELPEKVTDTMLSKLVEGVKEFEIHIEPVNLGKIAVKVLYEGNQATISIVCSEKRAMDALSQNAREIGNIIDRNLGGETTIIVEKQETDYLNQTRDENEQADQNAKQEKKDKNQNQDGEDAEQFLQKLRLGLVG